MQALTSQGLLEAVEADTRHLTNAVHKFDQRLRRFAAVTDLVSRGRPTIHTGAPAVPVGLFSTGDHLVAAFHVPSLETPEVADLLRVFRRDGRALRPAPNPFADHKGLRRWISDLYLSYRGRVRFTRAARTGDQIVLSFAVSHGDDSAPRHHRVGLDLGNGQVTLVKRPRLETPCKPDFEGDRDQLSLDKAPWESGGPTNAHYYHIKVGPLYVFVDWGALKVRDYLEMPRGNADLVLEGVTDKDHPVAPQRAEVLWPGEASADEEALVRVAPGKEGDEYHFYYCREPRRIERCVPWPIRGFQLPQKLGRISSMFLWARGEVVYLGGLDARPWDRFEAPGEVDHLFVFEDDLERITIHHFNSEKRRVLHSFRHLVAYAIQPDGHLFFIRGPAGEAPSPAFEHTLECYDTPFRLEANHHTEAEQRLLRSFDPRASEALVEMVRTLEPNVEAQKHRDALNALDRILAEHAFIERVPEVRTAVDRLHKTLASCVELEIELDEIHARRRESLLELEADLNLVMTRVRQKDYEGIHGTLESLNALRTLVGRLEALASEPHVPDDVVQGQGELQRKIKEQLEALSKEEAEQARRRVQQVRVRIDGLEPDIEGMTDLKTVEQALTRVRDDLKGLTDTVDRLQLLQLEPAKGLELTRLATSTVVGCERLETALAARRVALTRRRRAEALNAYLMQFDLRLATEPRAITSPEACDGHLETLVAELETRKSAQAELPEMLEALDARVTAARKRYGARKRELARARDQKRRGLETRFDLYLEALRAAGRGANLDPSALEGFLATHVEMAHCQAVLNQLVESGLEGVAASLKGRLTRALRMLVAERRETKTFLVEGETLRIAGTRFHRNRIPFELRERTDARGVSLELVGTGLVLGPERLAGLSPPPGYQGHVNESDTVSRAEYLVFRIMLEALEGGTWEALARLASQGEPASLEALQAEAHAAVVARSGEDLTLGLHDRDAARILLKVVPRWDRLGRLRWPSRVRMSAIEAWDKIDDPGQVAARASAALSFGRPWNDTSMARDTLRLASGDIGEHALEYLVAELEAGGLASSEAVAVHPRARALANTIRKQAGADELTKAFSSLDEVWARVALLRPLVTRQLEANWQEETRLATEVAWLLARKAKAFATRQSRTKDSPDEHCTRVTITGLSSRHARLEGGLTLELPDWFMRLRKFHAHDVASFEAFRGALEQTSRRMADTLDVDNLAPHPLAGFAWTRLLRRAYLPLVASALEKQLGSLDRPGQDQMGLLLLVSPPGYGKTELLKKLASLLGYAFVSVSGTALGRETRSLDPQAAPNGNAASALERLLLGLELRENVIVDIEDIQACSEALLDKLLPLCDATRSVEIVRSGQAQRIDLRGRRAAIVMTLNPLHAKIPQALANRATLVNLGEVAEKYAEDFALSYLEVAAPANPTLHGPSLHHDLEVLAEAHAQGRDFSRLDADLEGRYATPELKRIRAALEHCIAVRDVMVEVNRACLASASIQEAFRVDPPFELQGSYRDMVEICRSVEHDWDERTRSAAILQHYEGQAGLLGDQGEYNLLALRSLLGRLDEQGRGRLAHIREVFRLAQQRDRAVYVLMERITEMATATSQVPAALSAHAEGMRAHLEVATERAADSLESLSERNAGTARDALAQLRSLKEVVERGLAQGVEASSRNEREMAGRIETLCGSVEQLGGTLADSHTHAGQAALDGLARLLAGLQERLPSLLERSGIEGLELMTRTLDRLPEALTEGHLAGARAVTDTLDRLAERVNEGALELSVRTEARPEWSQALLEAVGGLRESVDRIASLHEGLQALESRFGALAEALEKSSTQTAVDLARTLETVREELARLATATEQPRPRNPLMDALRTLAHALPEADGPALDRAGEPPDRKDKPK